MPLLYNSNFSHTHKKKTKLHSGEKNVFYVRFSFKLVKVKVAQSCLTLCNSTDYTVHGNSLGQNNAMGNLSLLQGILPTQGSNPGVSHYRQILYQLGQKGSLLFIHFGCAGSSLLLLGFLWLQPEGAALQCCATTESCIPRVPCPQQEKPLQ